jgi:hypothetical protein
MAVGPARQDFKGATICFERSMLEIHDRRSKLCQGGSDPCWEGQDPVCLHPDLASLAPSADAASTISVRSGFDGM